MTDDKDLFGVHSRRRMEGFKDYHGGDPAEWPEDLQDCRHFPRSEAPV